MHPVERCVFSRCTRSRSRVCAPGWPSDRLRPYQTPAPGLNPRPRARSALPVDGAPFMTTSTLGATERALDPWNVGPPEAGLAPVSSRGVDGEDAGKPREASLEIARKDGPPGFSGVGGDDEIMSAAWGPGSAHVGNEAGVMNRCRVGVG